MSGYVAVPALDDVRCPKCGAENNGNKVHVWKVADGTGPRFECYVCAHSWRKEPNNEQK